MRRRRLEGISTQRDEAACVGRSEVDGERIPRRTNVGPSRRSGPRAHAPSGRVANLLEEARGLSPNQHGAAI